MPPQTERFAMAVGVQMSFLVALLEQYLERYMSPVS